MRDSEQAMQASSLDRPSAKTSPLSRGSGAVPIRETLQAPIIGQLGISRGNGPVITFAHVLLIFWGSQWAEGSISPTIGQVTDAIINILSGTYMAALDQYGVDGGVFKGCVTFGAFIGDSPPNPPSVFSDQDVEKLLVNLFNARLIPEPSVPLTSEKHLYIVIMPPGVRYTDPNVGGKHKFTSLSGQPAYYGWVLNQGLNFITSLFSHELVEAVTDPEGTAIQVSGSSVCTPNPTNWCEIGDVCGVPTVLNGVTVQSYWSQRDNMCVVPTDAYVKAEKDNKDSKDHKEHKDVKDSKEKDKDTKEKEGDSLISTISSLSSRLSEIGQYVDEMKQIVAKGQAFIRPEERPKVGGPALSQEEQEGKE